MKQTIVLKLEPSKEQFQSLVATMEMFNEACQYVADMAYEKRIANKIALQPLVYGHLRSEYGLSSQMAIRAIAKAVEAYKRDKRVHVQFDRHGAMVFDQRIMSFKRLTHVSLLCLSGRELIPMRYGAYQLARLDRAKGQADLVLKDGRFYLYVTVDLPEAPMIDATGVLGVDLGIVQIAVDSDGVQFSGESIMACRKRVREHRCNLQSARTRSAYKRLQKTANRQSRFVRDTNHVISKSIVQKALDSRKAIGLEILTGIKDRVNGSRHMRWLLGNWAFYQLRSFIGYKAKMVGVPVIDVDAAYTSQTCSQCGHCERANRKTQSQFKCIQCGLDMNADANAALNIRARAEVVMPNVPLACQ